MTSAFQVSSRLPEIRANGLATTNIALETTVRPTPRILTGTSTMIAVEEGGLFLVDAKQFMFKDATSFNQDLSSWSVDGVTQCLQFSDGATSWTLPQPNFTNCTP